MTLTAVFSQCLLLVTVFTEISGQVYYKKVLQNPDTNFTCTILQEDTLIKYKGFIVNDENALQVTVKSALSAPADYVVEVHDSSNIIEIFARKESVATAHLETLCKSTKQLELAIFQAQPEIQKTIDGGNQSNRIDVVFMGDGYQADERQIFFQDIRRLTKEMFEGVTFRSYLPVFNIWAIYVESVDSGIGYDGPKNTPFQLYRAAGQLRGIYPGNSNYARQVCQLTGAGGCDYPSLIGNDDFYGGLGGEFVISTRSNRTGTVVLRHEMGHNFVDVGEEYDNGQVYSGVNAANSLSTVGWTHWLTDSGQQPKAERAIYRLLEYPWADLWAEGEQSFTFTSDGNYSRWYLAVSVSAAGENDSLEFLLDGEILPWTTHGFDDREFYDWYGDEGFSLGSHNFSVRTKTKPTNTEIPRMICSIRLHEFGNENEFHIDNNYVSAYPTWDNFDRVTYRPTNAGCLMRNMTHNEFCPICREGMWYQFLQRISLIDSVDVATAQNPDGTRNVTLNTLALGQLRAPGNEVAGERLEVTWKNDDVEQVTLKDKFNIQAKNGSWSVEVNFVTPEVRNDPRGLLKETELFTV